MAKKRFYTDNPAWKGNNATIGSIHCWVRANFTKKNICLFCGKKGKTDWSNKKHTYLRIKKDWQELCRSCHQKYDFSKGLRKRKVINT